MDVQLCKAFQASALAARPSGTSFQSMASVVQARRQVWLSEANVSDQDCATVVAAPVVPGEVFGPSSGAALEQARKARELTYAVRQMGQMGLFLATGGWGRSTSSVQDWGGSQRTLTQSSLANLSRGNHHSFLPTAANKAARNVTVRIPGYSIT